MHPPARRKLPPIVILIILFGVLMSGAFVVVLALTLRMTTRTGALIDKNQKQYQAWMSQLPALKVENPRWENDRDLVFDVVFEATAGPTTDDLVVAYLAVDKTKSGVSMPMSVPVVTPDKPHRQIFRLANFPRKMEGRVELTLKSKSTRLVVEDPPLRSSMVKFNGWRMPIPFRAPRPDEMPAPP